MSRCLPLPIVPRKKYKTMEFNAKFDRKNNLPLPLPTVKPKSHLLSKIVSNFDKHQNTSLTKMNSTPSLVPVPIPTKEKSSDSDPPKRVFITSPSPVAPPIPPKPASFLPNKKIQVPDIFCGEVHDILVDMKREIKCYDGMGSVSLIDVSPRLCPRGRGIDFAAARSARVSYGSDLRTPEQDRALVRYLILNRHTSPLEFISFTFRVKCPIFVARHIMRHRTTSINEVSARYTIVPDECFKLKDVRVNNKLNKQSSGSTLADAKSKEDEDRAREIHEKACKMSMESYKALIDLGVARELARTVLPCGTFTDFYININLNNFLKFLSLRMADDAQSETREIAAAMFELCRPLSPAIFDTHSTMGGGLFLTENDVDSILKKSTTLVGQRTGRRERAEYSKKLERLNISF